MQLRNGKDVLLKEKEKISKKQTDKKQPGEGKEEGRRPHWKWFWGRCHQKADETHAQAHAQAHTTPGTFVFKSTSYI